TYSSHSPVQAGTALRDSAINWPSRRARGSGFFALTTHQMASRCYPGGCCWKNSQAVLSDLNCFSSAAANLRGAFSNEAGMIHFQPAAKFGCGLEVSDLHD